jgi:hypothetical protein
MAVVQYLERNRSNTIVTYEYIEQIEADTRDKVRRPSEGPVSLTFQHQHADPHPTDWLLHHRQVSLAFIVGIFKTLSTYISHERKFSKLWEPNSESRNIFWSEVVTEAEKLMEQMEKHFAIWKESAARAVTEGRATTKPLCNNELAGHIGVLVCNDIFTFFRYLRKISEFKNPGEVRNL